MSLHQNTDNWLHYKNSYDGANFIKMKTTKEFTAQSHLYTHYPLERRIKSTL